ncbi:F-box/RNI-like superfamily protein [Heracleum sosnowskyi]|uniref:F-box/RNI-like superfamily protein n=1 Tax=Heracleum sosnowskyi TaxID=360622 RepID=A0AAD8MGH1_9APIA|nr:F-box/RNI-like superfamily protein [Heracleum sosnowskyi]
MSKCSRKDHISDLPQSIIDSILTKLPIRDAVKTSILSTKWKYQWATLTQLLFDENLWLYLKTKEMLRNTVNYSMRSLLRHDGPIHKFLLSTSCLTTTTDIEQWLLFLSKKDIKVLDLLCMFSTIGGAKTKAPAEAAENLISGCPLLEKFRFSNMFDPLALTIRAPNLKHLSISDAFKDIYLEHTPRLISISIHLTTSLEGNFLTKVPVTYDCLKLIRLEDISFEQLNELLCVLHMITQSPNLQELQIMIKLLIWIFGRECPADFTFKQLKIVDISFVSSENVMQFLKFVLGHSPVLEVMSISINGNTDGKMKMLNKVLRFQRAFPEVKIKLSD